MTKGKIWVAIVGAGIVASLGAAIQYFPEINNVLIALSSLISAIVAFINGANNNE